MTLRISVLGGVAALCCLILPTATLVTYELDFKRLVKRKLNMAIADGRVFVDGRLIYTAEDLRVGLFTSTDNF